MSPEVIGGDGRIKDRQGIPPQGVSMGVYHNGSGTTSFPTGNTCVFNTKLWDSHGWYDPTTGAFTPKIPGYYRFSFRIRDGSPPAGGWSRAQAYKSGSFCDGDFQTANPGGSHGSGIVYLNGTTDQLRVIMTRSDGANYVVVGAASAPDHTFFYADLIGPSLGVMPEPWHDVGATGEPAFQNGWVNNDATNAPARFRKMPDGTVRLGGMIKNGTIGSPPGGTIFTLPVGYRPAWPMRFAAVGNGFFSWLEVGPTGTVYFNSGSNVWADLSPAYFVAEQ